MCGASTLVSFQAGRRGERALISPSVDTATADLDHGGVTGAVV